MSEFSSMGGVKKFGANRQNTGTAVQPAAETVASAAEMSAFMNGEPAVPVSPAPYEPAVSVSPAPYEPAVPESPESPIEVDDSTIPFSFEETGMDVCNTFAKQYSAPLSKVRCIADMSLLTAYMTMMERTHNVTFSFEAYGIDPIIFAEFLDKRENPTGQFELSVPCAYDDSGNATEFKSEHYEVLDIDGKLYLSCVDTVLNEDYLRSVIAQGVEALAMHDRFVYTFVGPRPLSFVTPQGESAPMMIETLKLNTRELSILLSYMKNVEGAGYKRSVVDGHTCMVFMRG